MSREWIPKCPFCDVELASRDDKLVCPKCNFSSYRTEKKSYDEIRKTKVSCKCGHELLLPARLHLKIERDPIDGKYHPSNFFRQCDHCGRKYWVMMDFHGEIETKKREEKDAIPVQCNCGKMVNLQWTHPEKGIGAAYNKGIHSDLYMNKCDCGRILTLYLYQDI